MLDRLRAMREYVTRWRESSDSRPSSRDSHSSADSDTCSSASSGGRSPASTVFNDFGDSGGVVGLDDAGVLPRTRVNVASQTAVPPTSPTSPTTPQQQQSRLLSLLSVPRHLGLGDALVRQELRVGDWNAVAGDDGDLIHWIAASHNRRASHNTATPRDAGPMATVAAAAAALRSVQQADVPVVAAATTGGGAAEITVETAGRAPVTPGQQVFSTSASSTVATAVTRPLTVRLIRDQASDSGRGVAAASKGPSLSWRGVVDAVRTLDSGVVRAVARKAAGNVGYGTKTYVTNMIGPDSVSATLLQLLRTGSILGLQPFCAAWLRSQGYNSEASERLSYPVVAAFMAIGTAPIAVHRIQKVLTPNQRATTIWANMFGRNWQQLCASAGWGALREVPFWAVFPGLRRTLRAQFACDDDGRCMQGAKNFAVSGAAAAASATLTYPFDPAMKLAIRKSRVFAFPELLLSVYQQSFRHAYRAQLRQISGNNLSIESLLISVAAQLEQLKLLRVQGIAAGQQELLKQIAANRAQLDVLGVDVKAAGTREVMRAFAVGMKNAIRRAYSGFGLALRIMPVTMGTTFVALEGAQWAYTAFTPTAQRAMAYCRDAMRVHAEKMESQAQQEGGSDDVFSSYMRGRGFR